MADKRQFITLTNLGTFADEIKSKYALLGTASDTSATKSIEGTRKYAKEQADAVLGTAQDASSANTVYGAKALAAEKVASVGATANKGIEMGGTATAPTVGIKLSSKAGNDLSFATGDGEDGGLYFKQAAAAEYTITKQASADDGFVATYQLFKDSTAVGDKINIPKDFLVKGASIKTVATADQPYEGAKVGDKYIDFEINVKSGSATTEHLYLPVQELVDAYVGDNQGIVLGANNTFSLKIKTGSALSVSNDGLDIAEASQSAKGTMSAADKTKLDGISAEANKVAVDANGVGTGSIDGTAVTFYDIDADVEAVTAQQVQALLA